MDFGTPFIVFLILIKELKYVNNSCCHCRTSVSKEGWEKLEGTFSLATMPDRVVFYLEGPAPGVDLLIESVIITCSCPSECNVIIHFNLFLLLNLTSVP